MAKGKVQHWKHGWIPIDPLAEAVVAKKASPKRKPANWVPPADNVPKWKPSTPAEAKKLIAKELAKTPGEMAAENEATRIKRRAKEAAPTMVGSFDAQAEYAAARARREQYRDVTTVDGVDFIHYKESRMDPMGTEHGEPYQLTRDQMQPLADAYNEVKAEFPGLKPVQIVGVKNRNGAFGITSWDGHRISISDTTFTPEGIEAAKESWGKRGTIAAQFIDDPEGFARAVMTHELGHALQMQNHAAKTKGMALATERVTADQLGIPTKGWEPEATKRKIPRWAADTLGGQSMYATANEYEWFAEAFADGYFNLDKATPQGKAVIAMLHEQYGTGKAAA